MRAFNSLFIDQGRIRSGLEEEGFFYVHSLVCTCLKAAWIRALTALVGLLWSMGFLKSVRSSSNAII